MDTKSAIAARHSKLYIDTMIFQVDNAIFKVPSRYFHEKSEAFGIASKISAENLNGEGSSDENPIKLSPLPHDANAEDFELLVNVIMSFTFNLPPPTGYTLCQWFAVLKLATAWEFSDIRTLAMKSITDDKTRIYDQWFGIFVSCWNLEGFTELRELAITRVSGLQKWSAMQKINNGRWYCVRRWATEGLKDLAEAPSLPSFQEIESLGLHTVVNFMLLREAVLKRCTHCASGYSRVLRCSNCDSTVSTQARCNLVLVEKYCAQELSQIEL
ncbi:hypothetical protein E1B28_010277 [Marasmius oreades]|uniref:BTB domain-containing protein n=1 Tax=Marasmius oreades TaxID=181124 RepID=A0A9P7RWT8_9AGAR|nr:uncharacterized protein E1B28_010277 [Marasmius oreades]KAG7091226.1 hypothetical protein E1B28_010277 [Marasmius oreades]